MSQPATSMREDHAFVSGTFARYGADPRIALLEERIREVRREMDERRLVADPFERVRRARESLQSTLSFLDSLGALGPESPGSAGEGPAAERMRENTARLSELLDQLLSAVRGS